MGSGENRFDPTAIAAMNSALDDIDAAVAADELIAMVTTGVADEAHDGSLLRWRAVELARPWPDRDLVLDRRRKTSTSTRWTHSVEAKSPRRSERSVRCSMHSLPHRRRFPPD